MECDGAVTKNNYGSRVDISNVRPLRGGVLTVTTVPVPCLINSVSVYVELPHQPYEPLIY